MAFPLGELLVILGAVPLGMRDGVAGPFVKRLAEELGAGPTHGDPFAPTAGLLHRSNAGFGPEGVRFFDELPHAQRNGKDEAARVLGLLTVNRREDLVRALERAGRYRAFSWSAGERKSPYRNDFIKRNNHLCHYGMTAVRVDGPGATT
jgi:hypothetical protein